LSKIFGYGEDALTLWLLKNQPTEILKEFNDSTLPSDCIVFYRPSFGRSGGKDSAEFGEFDAILASKEKVYLIESKWDNHRPNNQTKLVLTPEQTERHEVFRWYLSNWSQKYSSDWEAFAKDKGAEFISDKKIAPSNSLLAVNLQHILRSLNEHCSNSANEINVKNILLFFHSSKSKPPQKSSEEFTVISVRYDVSSNYVKLV
jgi:hypothetical protein